MAGKFNPHRQIYGVDFSGAYNAGHKIWIAIGVPKCQYFIIESCFPAASLPDSGRRRDKCLTALRNFIKKQKSAAFGMDFPFGLPKGLVQFGSWTDFVLGFPNDYTSPEKFKEACASTASGIELKRKTDIESKAPFSPYNLRLYRQTYYGISMVLHPLVRAHFACVIPMQEGLLGKPWILEVCPASFLKRKHRYIPYKGRINARKEARSFLLEAMERFDDLCIRNSSIRETVIEEQGGDALDSVIAALITFQALRYRDDFAVKNEIPYAVEGYVYS